MRLIDADALADVLFDKRKNYPQWVADSISTMPDAVVLCKDCKYSSYHLDRFDNQYVCMRNTDKWGKVPECDLKGHRANWFCADGERQKGW